MSSACTPILVGVVFPVSELLLLSKTAKFPFLPMDYSPWSSKNLIYRNQLKKFMQVEIDKLCMCTNFGGCDLSCFGGIVPVTYTVVLLLISISFCIIRIIYGSIKRYINLIIVYYN